MRKRGKLLGRLCKVSEPEGDGGNVEHGKVVLGALFVSCGDAAELLEAIEQALHTIASSISLSVEPSSATLVALGGDHRSDAARTQLLARGLARKGLVSHHPPGPQTWAAPLAADHTRIEHGRKGRAVVALTAGQMKGDGLAGALGPHVDLGREASA